VGRDRRIASITAQEIADYRARLVERHLAASTINQTRAIVHGIFALFLTAAFTGLRASELRALRWRSVDFGASLIHLERGFTGEGGEDLPKSYRVRSVPLMPQVALELTKLA
jgi:integrase